MFYKKPRPLDSELAISNSKMQALTPQVRIQSWLSPRPQWSACSFPSAMPGRPTQRRQDLQLGVVFRSAVQCDLIACLLTVRKVLR